MADEEKTLNSAETESPVEEPKKAKKEKAPKESKADKQAAKNAKKEKAQMQKDWENSILATKRVKREEMRRKLKRAMLFMLVVALIITSVVYIMLLFIDENNVRITASSSKGQKISLSIDNEVWSPYINGKGPDHMIDLSYNKVYGREEIPTIEQIYVSLLNADNFEVGAKSKNGYICFAFLLRNDGTEPASVNCEMTLEYDKLRNLQDAVRVMWGTSTKNHPEQAAVRIFASLSSNDRLYGTYINTNREPKDKYIEYVAYPVGSDNPSFDMIEYEKNVSPEEELRRTEAGYFASTPFHSDEYVFKFDGSSEEAPVYILEGGDIMFCYVCIWIEGSDFDCEDSVLGGYAKMSINFTAN